MSRIDHRLVSAGVISLLTLGPVGAGAQSRDAIAANTRVRNDFPTGERPRFRRERMQTVVGALEAVRADTLLLIVRPDAVPLRIPRTAIGTLYVSRGRPPRWRSALESSVTPALVAAALAAVGASIHRREGDPSPAQMMASSAAWAGASGALVGAWSPRERWRAISRSDSIANLVSTTRAK